MKSYSQLGQDVWVLNKMPIKNGYFVDIGFNDGVQINNTYLLELNGWTGIGIDPLAKNYELRPNTTIYKEAVYTKPNDKELDFVKHGSLSGFVDFINHHKNILTSQDSEFIKIKTKTLSEILTIANSPNFIHYISLDTEGSEYSILESFPFDKYSFGCLTVEHNYIQPNRKNIQKLLESRGYKLEQQLKWDDCYINQYI